MRTNSKVELRVGIFVLAALTIGAIVVFSVGNRRNVFSSKLTYYAVFEDVVGLRAGSPVHMGGVNVGTVGNVELQGNGRVHVELEIVRDAQPLIREDTFASIGSKGMLGDRLVDLTTGSPEAKVVPAGGVIPTRAGGDAFSALRNLTNKAEPIVEHAAAIAENLHKATEPLAQNEFQKDLQATVKNLAKISEYVAVGDGTVNRLFTDKELADSIEETLQHVQSTAENLSKTSDTVASMASEIRTGDGAAHELIYGKEGRKLVRNLANATGELSIILRDVRTTDSTVHDLLYGRKAEDLLENLTAVSADFRAISADLRAGKGTLGGLLVDPSIYEDIKRLVGDLQRNEILRALVRYSISQDEKAERIEVKSPE